MSKNIEIKFKKLDELAVVPSYAHHGDVGMDMTAIDVEYNLTNDMYIYHTGLAFESDFNIAQFLFVRSSNCKTDSYLCNHVGIADSAIYRGEIQFRFKNRDSLQTMIRNEQVKYIIEHGSWDKKIMDDIREQVIKDTCDLKYAPYDIGARIGQMVFAEYPTVNLVEVKELSETERGDGGFGSTNKK